MRELRLAPPAYDDFKTIADYTVERFGLDQAEAYAGRLLEAMERLRSNPFLGTAQDEILMGTRRLVHESHTIYYTVANSAVVVLRILGPGQDPLTELS